MGKESYVHLLLDRGLFSEIKYLVYEHMFENDTRRRRDTKDTDRIQKR